MAELFDATRDLVRFGRTDGAYDNTNMWIGREVREGAAWAAFAEVAYTAIDALEEATRNLASLVETVAEEKPELVTDVADGQRRMREMHDALKLIVTGEDERHSLEERAQSRPHDIRTRVRTPPVPSRSRQVQGARIASPRRARRPSAIWRHSWRPWQRRSPSSSPMWPTGRGGCARCTTL